MPEPPDHRQAPTQSRLSERWAPGIQRRHKQRCAKTSGGHCDCAPSYQAQVWSPREQRQVRRGFTSLEDAKTWRDEARVALHRGTLRAPSHQTLNDAAAQWLTDARAGIIRTRSGYPYKPSAIRTYRLA